MYDEEDEQFGIVLRLPLYAVVSREDASYDPAHLPRSSPLLHVVASDYEAPGNEKHIPLFTSWRRAMRFVGCFAKEMRPLKLRTPQHVVRYLQSRGDIEICFNPRLGWDSVLCAGYSRDLIAYFLKIEDELREEESESSEDF